jgi:DNA-binding transcriptional LysR family regulator
LDIFGSYKNFFILFHAKCFSAGFLPLARAEPINFFYRQVTTVKTQDMEVFLAVVRYGSISKAARQLHFSQPAVSVIIQSLEKELGVPLLVRTPRLTHSVVQTPQGEEFKKFAESVVEQYRTLRHRLALSGEPAALTLNSGRSSRAMILARIARHFSETYPAVPVRLRTCMDSATAMGELLSGDCDISLSSYDPEDSRYVSVPILTDPLVLIAPSDMELDDSIALDALPALPMIMRERPAISTSWSGASWPRAGWTPPALTAS